MLIEDFLVEATQCPSVSGYEYNAVKIIKDYFKTYTDTITTDKLGNVIALKRGTTSNFKIMLAAHMDEIGLMITDIKKNGSIKFTQIGGFDPRTLISQNVVIHGAKDITGVIVLSDESKTEKVKLKDLHIDTGYTKKELITLVNVGDIITIDRKMSKLDNNILTGKCLDDKAGIAVMLQCAKELSNMKHDGDIYFVSTVQEEVGYNGAKTGIYSIDPDIGIAIDVGFGKTPEIPDDRAIHMGKGAAITMGGNIHPSLRKHMTEVAKKYNIPHQFEVSPGATGTDAWIMQISKAGIPCILLSIPLRYMHTSVETVDIKDILNAGQLLAQFIINITDDLLEGLLCY
ncbi:M42 family metallopeptidase [Clostridiisalibacter paucivorans]|uniref:M42 family metallopeptidase n=1 Tax=Clostridiisalibacter paucivorans TaxID=408753 RepID=UPI00047E7745|nr:M42 family metallopeptidase [Clostridiisalibacter paucivorans]